VLTDHRPSLDSFSPSAMSCRLKLFGGAALEAGDERVTGRAAQRHRLALLALLASTRRPGRSRDQLIALLWPESDTARARHLLSDAVYRINQGLGAEVITAAGDDLRLNGQLVTSDVADFERAVLVSEHARAVELYAGPFLDGFFLPAASDFERWVGEERGGYQREAARSLETLAEQCESRGDAPAAVDLWKRLAALTPESSRVALRLVKAYELCGDRSAAMRHGQLHTALLREMLELEPDAAFVSYLEELRHRSSPPAHAPGELAARPPEQTSPEPARVESARPEPTPRAPTPSGPGRAPSRFRGWHLTVAVAALAAIGWGATRLARRGPQDASGDRTLTSAIAVLPFRNLSAADSSAYVADGMTEELIYMLSRVGGLKVSSRTSVYAFRDSALTVRELAARLGVGWVVEGAVRREGRRLRITAQLTSARDEYQHWSDSYDREEEALFAIQEGIAAAIAERVARRTTDAAATVGAREARGADDAMAYDLYLRGRYHWHRRTEADLRRAAQLFQQAVDRAPQYARGWVGLGDALAVLGFYDYLPPREAFPPAEAAARRALAIAPGLAAPHATLGYVHLYHHWRWTDAELELRRAIAMDPGYSTAHQWLANLYTARGRFAEAEQEMQSARQLDPLSLIANAALGWVWTYAGQYERAINQLHSTLELDPTFELAHLFLGIAQDNSGSEDAVASLREAVRRSNGSAISLAALAHAWVRAGIRDSATVILATLLAREARGAYVPSYELARVHVALGDTAAALARLERAEASREHSLALLRVDPYLTPLRRLGRFEALVRRVNGDSGGPLERR